jgi:hypothetical protein
MVTNCLMSLQLVNKTLQNLRIDPDPIGESQEGATLILVFRDMLGYTTII